MDSSLFHLRIWTQMDRPVSVVLEAKGRVSVALDDDFLEPAVSGEKLARRHIAGSAYSKFLLYLKGLF